MSPFLASDLIFKTQLLTTEKKILIKQSYLLMMWFYYLTLVYQKKQEKNKFLFVFLPKKKYIFTATKAPIAHKNWSKEQYQKQIFKIKICFKGHLNDSLSLNNLNLLILLLLLTKKTFPIFETNLMYLKTYLIFFFYYDKNYFNYYQFLSTLNNQSTIRHFSKLN